MYLYYVDLITQVSVVKTYKRCLHNGNACKLLQSITYLLTFLVALFFFVLLLWGGEDLQEKPEL